MMCRFYKGTRAYPKGMRRQHDARRSVGFTLSKE